MLRSRKQKSSSITESSDRMKMPYGNGDVVRSTNNVGNQHRPLIPAPILIGIVLLFLFLGVATEHYKRTRGVDPFSLLTLDVHETISLTTDGASPLSGKSILSSDEDKNLEYSDNERYHVIFSTDCGSYQNWQR